MATSGKMSRFRVKIAKLDAWRREPDKVKLEPRERIRLRLRCRLCGRPRAVFRKFGICRICLRNMAHEGIIPGLMKASW